MYHSRFKRTHYEAGFNYGDLLNKHGIIIDSCPTFEITNERINFAYECEKMYKKFYPQIIEEIKGFAEGNRTSYEFLMTLIFTMYCYDVNNRCSCFAIKDNNNIVFGRNSDFLVSIEKLYMNCLYCLDNTYKFNANTTAFIEMEDGVNEHGLAIGLTFIPVKNIKPGFNVGVLLRYLLENCTTVEEAIAKIKSLPIASGGTLTMIDNTGNMKVVELSSDEINVIDGNNYVCATNIFMSKKMKKYNLESFDNWRAMERYNTLNECLKKNIYSLELAKELLSGKYGFICQYDRKTNADTVWSVIYDIKNSNIYRVEGNPKRKKYKKDIRMKFKD